MARAAVKFIKVKRPLIYIVDLGTKYTEFLGLGWVRSVTHVTLRHRATNCALLYKMHIDFKSQYSLLIIKLGHSVVLARSWQLFVFIHANAVKSIIV